MKSNFFIAMILAAAFCSCSKHDDAPTDADLARYVNPLIGTDGTGHTFPGAIRPFGMVQVSPDTRVDTWEGCSGYHYSDSVILGFSHTHLNGTGCLDLGDVLLMPFTGKGSVLNTEYSSPFSHKNEIAEAGYYSVLLDKSNIKVELTAAKRVGLQRYTYPETAAEKGLTLDLAHRDEVLEASLRYDRRTQTLTGTRNSRSFSPRQLLSFATQFSCPVRKIEVFRDNKPVMVSENDTIIELFDKNCKALIYFADNVKQVTVRTAISADVETPQAALKNMAETPDFDFDAVRRQARDEWNSELSKIIIETPDEAKKRIFYTALYHCFTSPYLFTDIDGSYLGRDYRMHRVEDGREVYSVFSLWDTYRALHPLLNIIDRRRSENFIYTFLKNYEQAGRLPVWELFAGETNCMIGYHSVPVIYDAFEKGIFDYDRDLMLSAMTASAHEDWRGLKDYERFGYIPADREGESVSKTLEYAFDDWCISRFAREIGNEDVYVEFVRRCQNYKNMIDPQGFMHARVNGAFTEPFDPAEVNSAFTEANSWQYSTYVPHDADGFISLHGGDDATTAFLDSLFTADSRTTGRNQADVTGLIGQYAHGNEPSHHAAYFYNFTGRQWRAAELVRKILTELYNDTPDGLCGNEDCGQMSAWYVFSSIGFYPFCPGSNQYALGSPLFDRATVNLENGKQFTVVCKHQSDKNRYIKSASLNGKEYSKSYITFDDIRDGGELTLIMGSQPEKSFGQQPENRPHTWVKPSVTTTPVFSPSVKTFADSLTVTISAREGNTVYYTLGKEPITTSSKVYSEPVVITGDATLRAAARNAETGFSKEVQATYVHYKKTMDIDVKSHINPLYDGGGRDALIDGLRGTNRYNLGCWQGFNGEDFEATLDLRSVRTFSEVGAGFLQDTPTWIVFPPEVSFEISDDGQTFRPYGAVAAPRPVDDLRAQTFDYTVRRPAKARYIRIRAKTYGALPSWHGGAGEQAHLFVDEVFVK